MHTWKKHMEMNNNENSANDEKIVTNERMNKGKQCKKMDTKFFISNQQTTWRTEGSMWKTFQNHTKQEEGLET